MLEYTTEQHNAFGLVRNIVVQLVKHEHLQKRAHQTIYDIDHALDQAWADIDLDTMPPYSVLEERLRVAVREARDLGLARDPFIQKVGALAFS